MSAAATRLPPRVVGTELAFSLASATVVGVLAPHFLLLSGDAATEGAFSVGGGLLLGGLAGAVHAWLRVRRHRYVLRSLAVGSSSVEPHELLSMADEPRVLLLGWLLPSTLGAGLTSILFRPAILDLNTGITLCLLGLVIAAAAALPLFVLVRSAFLAAIELAPHEAMREVVEQAERDRRIGQRVSRRMQAAVTTPVLFLAMGSALIVNAHVRRADERGREETARVLARAALEASPGVVARAGLDDALETGKVLGFSSRLGPAQAGYRVERGDDGRVNLLAPLDTGSVLVTFSGSTVGFIGLPSLLVAVLAASLAGLLGTLLGSTLAHDLRGATRNVRELGTETVLGGGTRIIRRARYQVVARLGRAVERLAQRFRVFAQAQERAIEARKAAARMRGLFFASVSHDLKSPLNAILGFTELARSETLSPGQLESVDLIERRGRELLALIETILDAARVEAGQLTLELDRTDVTALLSEAAQKGRDLAADHDAPVVIEASPDLPPLKLDRVRAPRALSTFVAHALRTTEASSVRLSAGLDGNMVRIDVEIVRHRFNAWRLEAMLDPGRDPGVSEHRGLALGLRLARGVIELHGGKVEVRRRGTAGGAITMTFPPAAPA